MVVVKVRNRYGCINSASSWGGRRVRRRFRRKRRRDSSPPMAQGGWLAPKSKDDVGLDVDSVMKLVEEEGKEKAAAAKQLEQQR